MQTAPRMKYGVSMQKMPAFFENLAPREMDNQTRSNMLAQLGRPLKVEARAGEGEVNRRRNWRDSPEAGGNSRWGSPCSRGVLYLDIVGPWTLVGYANMAEVQHAAFGLTLNMEDAIHYHKVRARKQKIIQSLLFSATKQNNKRINYFTSHELLSKPCKGSCHMQCVPFRQV